MARLLNTHSHIASLVIALIAVAAIFFTLVVPPLQKPDEEAHLIRTLSIAGGHVFCKPGSPDSIPLENGITTMIKDVKALKLPNHAERKFNLSLYRRQLFSTAEERTTNLYTVPSVYCGFPVIPYLPQVAGIMLGRVLQLNAYLIFFLGRLIMLAVAALWARHIYKRTPEIYKPGMLFVFSLPMLLHQVSSYSYDPVHILLACSLFAIITAFRNRKDLIWLWLIFLGLFLSKTGGYELLLFTYFIVPRNRVAPSLKSYLLKTVLFFVSLFLVLGAFKFVELRAMAAGASLGKGVDPIAQLYYSLNHPLSYLTMLVKTTYHFGIFYLQSFIGILGWLEYGFPHIVYGVYCLAFAYLILTATVTREHILSRKKLLFVTVLLATSYVYILSIFYLLWNPVGSVLTDGIQGRYFLVFTLFIYLMLIQYRQHFFPTFRLPYVLRPWVIVCISIAVALTCMYSVIYRYYL